MDTINYSMSNDVQIPVGELRVGMFVTGLDRDWLETPFLTQGFYIRAPDDIEQVARYCRYVWVSGRESPFSFMPVNFASGELIGRKPHKHAKSKSLKHEFRKVNGFIADANTFAKSMLDDVRLGRAIDTEQARTVVQDCVQSIIRHPDALTWMTKMRTENLYTSEHCLNVCILSVVFGRKLGLKQQQLINLGLCGLLHDVGKMRIPDEILNKPGPHDEQERAVMQKHAEEGKQLLMEKRGMYQGAIEAAYHHHERPDGQGYPQGLSAEEIPLFSKIISIVDAYDAMTGDRVYSRGRPSNVALRIIYEERGRQFDEKLALGFIQTIGLYPPGSIVELVNGYIGLVFEADSVYRHLPKVLLMLDEEKQPTEHRVVDLAKTESGELDKGFHITHLLPDGSYGIRLRDCFEQGLLTL